MVMSIRKISYENPELTGAGMWWFPDLNEQDPFCILPVAAALLNYFNLTVSARNQKSNYPFFTMQVLFIQSIQYICIHIPLFSSLFSI